MCASPYDRHFRAIWHRTQIASSLDAVTSQQIREWAEEKRLDVVHVEEREVGAFVPTRAIVLTTGGVQACFPLVPPMGDATWEKRRQAAEVKAALWEKMEWFSPLWVPVGAAERILQDARACSRERAIELFDYHTSTLYTVPFQAICIAQIMPVARSLVEFCPLAREAFLAFYSGYRAASISALIPIIEGSLNRIAANSGGDLPIAGRIDDVIDRAIESAASLHYDRMWVPQPYLSKEYLLGQDERVFFLETFRRWLQRSFFQKTGEYDGVTWLNRHVFAHGTGSSWQQSGNFGRLVVALATLAVTESWHDETHHVSVFFPEMNEEAKLLWQQGLFQANAQMKLKLVEQERYQTHGRLVPEMPTDDGVLLRRAILLDDCIKDLVRPLRNTGWQVHVGEPDERALHVSVVATAEGERLEIALLYSCATSKTFTANLLRLPTPYFIVEPLIISSNTPTASTFTWDR